MPLFELDAGRLAPVELGTAVPDPVEPAELEAVREHALEIVARPLLPVRRRPHGGDPVAGGPDLVALDPNGQVVAVAVLPRADADAVLRLLGQAATSARLSWAQIAEGYPAGPDAFRGDWAAFQEAAPRGQSGPRAILLTFDVPDGVRPGLEALVGSALEAIELTVRQLAGGRRFVDAAAIRPSALPGPGVMGAGPARRSVVAGPRDVEPDDITPPGGIEVGPAAEAAADLRLLAESAGAAVDLVLTGPDGADHTAVLEADGGIVLPDGIRAGDPAYAARLLGLDVADDGAWSAWRIGSDGPTLAEARAEVRAAARRRAGRGDPRRRA